MIRSWSIWIWFGRSLEVLGPKGFISSSFMHAVTGCCFQSTRGKHRQTAISQIHRTPECLSVAVAPVLFLGILCRFENIADSYYWLQGRVILPHEAAMLQKEYLKTNEWNKQKSEAAAGRWNNNRLTTATISVKSMLRVDEWRHCEVSWSTKFRPPIWHFLSSLK